MTALSNAALLSLLPKTFTIDVNVLDDGKSSSHEVGFVGLSRFELDELVNTWGAVEVTDGQHRRVPRAYVTEESG
jgi:hypothetical protein